MDIFKHFIRFIRLLIISSRTLYCVWLFYILYLTVAHKISSQTDVELHSMHFIDVVESVLFVKYVSLLILLMITMIP